MNRLAANLAAFHLVGDRSGLPAEEASGRKLRPALFANYRDLSRLRYDFPLILGNEQTTEDKQRWACSLTDLINFTLQKIAPRGLEGEETRRQVLSLEQEIRNLVASGQDSTLSRLWEEAAATLLSQSSEIVASSLNEHFVSAQRALDLDGEVLDCDTRLSGRLIKHAWQQSQQFKTNHLRTRIIRLAQKLKDILRVGYMHSDEARDAGHLESSLGKGDQAVFDFQAMARVLKSAPVGPALPENRQKRLQETISTLESQGFVAINTAHEIFNFIFEDCQIALDSYRERLPDMARLVKAISIAELEIENRYDESQHDASYKAFDEDQLGPADLALFPSYLICLENGPDHENTRAALDILRSGISFKILVQSDDILGQLSTASGQLSFGIHGQQLAGMALGLNNVFVLQSAAASLYQLRESVMKGLTSNRPALFSVYSGLMGENLSYLTAAAATESRSFPCFVYAPESGENLAGRFHLNGNPATDRDWCQHVIQYEDAEHNPQNENIAFTLVDFIACDRRFDHHFARVAKEDWDDRMLPIDIFLGIDTASRAGKVPYVLLIDEENVLHRAVCDDKLIDAAQRCLERWHNLQELGGINNSHALLALAQAKDSLDKEQKLLLAQAPAQTVAETAAEPASTSQEKTVPETRVIETTIEVPPEETSVASSDDPWIETIRCTTCNECTELNDRMFAYDGDKRAYVCDANAGTYRELVEAAEACQVAIIHPGKPRNPNEAGLDELLVRADPFNM
jgi:hypothetical protein